jgi:hypothetical protein
MLTNNNMEYGGEPDSLLTDRHIDPKTRARSKGNLSCDIVPSTDNK